MCELGEYSWFAFYSTVTLSLLHISNFYSPFFIVLCSIWNNDVAMQISVYLIKAEINLSTITINICNPHFLIIKRK